MKLQPLLHTPNFTKGINSKLYKIEMETNEDDRELGETQSTAEITNEITELLQNVIGFAQDFNNQLANLSTQRMSTTTREIPSLPQTGKFIVAIDKLIRLVSGVDFNDFNPQNIDAIQSYLDNLEQLNQSIMSQDISLPVRNPVIEELFRQLESVRDQIKFPLDSVINSLRTKMISRRQTQPILGSGFMRECIYDKYGLLNVNPYQTKLYV